MDETPTSPDVNELQAQCNWLRKQVQIILVLLILVSGIFALFLQRQNKYAALDVAGVRPMIEDYNKNQAPMMDDFIKRLADYGRTHPDFAAISTKYGLNQPSQLPGTAPAPKK